MEQKEINFQSLLDISRHMTLDEFHSRYKNVKIINKTRNSTVRLAIHVQTGQNVIIKSVYKNSIVNSQLKIVSILKEVNVLTFLRESKHVTQIYDVVYCLDSFHIVLEYADCGDLFNFINNHRKNLPETDVKHFFKPIAKTVAMIHRNNIAHRDLKLENILFDNGGRIMIADFGFATKFNKKSFSEKNSENDENNLCASICGTVNYEPPEIIRGDKYDPMKADSWSVGIILYVLMFKYFPFYSPSITDTVQLILTSEVKYPEDMRDKFSDEICDILQSLLVKDPNERMYIEDVVSSHANFFGFHPPANNETECDDFNIFNTNALDSLFGMNSTASIGNVMKQERIHNSALNTITRSKDDFENLSADEFISYQIIKRRYQLGQIRYMKARYKSIAPGDFLKIPPNESAKQTKVSTNSNLDLKRVLINKDDDQRKINKNSSDESNDDDIDTNLINYEEQNKSSEENSKSNEENSGEETSNSDQINLALLCPSNVDKVRRTGKYSRNSLNKQFQVCKPIEVLDHKKTRQLSPVGSKKIVKIRSKNKTPSLSPSLTSPTNSYKALPSFLFSSTAPLSSQLPPPIHDGQSDDVIHVEDENTKTVIKAKKSRRLSKEKKLNSNDSSLSNLGNYTSKLSKHEKLIKPTTDFTKLPNLNPASSDPLSSIKNDSFNGLDNRSILNLPESDDGMKYNSQEEIKNLSILTRQPPNLNNVQSRKRNKSSNEFDIQSNYDDVEKNAHKTNFSLETLITKVNDFINKNDEINIICEEESGAFVKVGNDESNELMVMITFARSGNKSSSYSLNMIRGSDENLEKFEKLIASEIGV